MEQSVKKNADKLVAPKSFCGMPVAMRGKKKNKRPRLLFQGGSVLVGATLHANGFSKTGKGDYCISWVGRSLRGHDFKHIKGWQRINFFPRTQEITRKDALAQNIIKMQQLHGAKHFDFIP